MPSFTESALRLLKPLFASRSRSKGSDYGYSAILDGDTAVALTEAAISEAAVPATSGPHNSAALAWRTEQHRRQGQHRERQLTTISTEGIRGSVAAACGLSMTGLRATAFLTGPESASLQDLLATLAGRHLPLVMHIDNQATGGPSSAAGSGHEACHLSTQNGCFVLCAANVQEAVDFSLIARKVAEQTLMPGLVFMDREQTASSPQQVILPSRKFLDEYLGKAEDLVSCISPAEKLLFGDKRRRVPRWHDPDRPVLMGGVQPTGIWGLAKAASRLYLEEALGKSIEQAFRLFASRSGRQYSQLTVHRVADAELLLVAMGSAIETAEAAAERVRSTQKLKIGVLGIRALAPFPGEMIAAQMGNAQTICVLERLDPGVTATPPLLRELKAAINPSPHHPRLLSVLYGMGGLPLRDADLVELCVKAQKIQQQVYLGISFDHITNLHPKRQVLLDRLRRDYPGVALRGLSGKQVPETDISPANTVSLAFHRISGTGGAGLCQDAAHFLWKVAGGELRSRIAQPLVPWGESCIDWFTWAPAEVRDPGDRLTVHLAVVSAAAIENIVSDPGVKQQGALLIDSPAAQSICLPMKVIERLRQRHAQVYTIDATKAGADTDLRNERMLGAAFAILLDKELLDTGYRRLLSSRESILSDLPKDLQEARLHAFKDGFGQITRVANETLTARSQPADAEQVSPLLRRLGNIDDQYDCLPRFLDQIGILYREQQSDQITPDPYLAIGAVPPFSTAFNKFDRLREAQPVLDAEACTGCGACWSLCPDGAIGVTAINPAMLLETGVSITGMEGLRPMLSGLSRRMHKRCLDRGAAPLSAAELLNEAFDWLLQQSLPENRKLLATEAHKKFVEAFGELPICVTDSLFREPESDSSGTGNILFLAINPATCKGCGICVSNCEPNALNLESQTLERTAETKLIWRLWEKLPQTTRATVERSGTQQLPGKTAAILMSPQFRGTLSGGDGAEPGSGERLALRLALAAAESRQRPLVDAFFSEVNAIRERLSTLIRKMLADALPADDLDALATGLNSVDSSDTELGRFINDTEGAIDNRIDTLRLRRLVALAQKLRDLSCQLSKGRQGFGRASLGLVLSSDSATGWAGVFPDNPFAVPVSVDTSGDAAQFAAGLQYGQLQQAMEGFVLMRKATLELENPADAARLWSTIEHIGWDDLTVQERALCPAVLIVGSSTLLAGRGLSQLAAVMAGNLPVKLMLFAELDLGLASGARIDLPLAPVVDPGMDLALLALSRRNTFNAQSSVGYPSHLMETLEAALNYSGPALIQVHAPSPERHGFRTDQTIQQARLAVESRTFPLFCYDPEGEGVFGSRFNLEENPEPHADWMSNAAGTGVTTASWALGESRFAQWLSPLRADVAEALSLDQYIALPEAARNGKTPVVINSEGTRFQVRQVLVKACEERLHCWRTLQEVSGLVTPFTRRIEQQAEQSVAAAHQAELQAVKGSYETRIEDLKQEMLEQFRAEIRMRLMSMAGYDPDTTEEKPGVSH